MRTIATLALPAAVLIGATAAPASATSVIGFGNSAHDNTCVNLGGAPTQAATTQQPGILNSLITSLPYSGPGNQCGDLGVPDVVAQGDSYAAGF